MPSEILDGPSRATIPSSQSRNGHTYAELWAMPPMLRLVCLERLILAIGTMDGPLSRDLKLSSETLAGAAGRPVDQIAKPIAYLIAIDAITWADLLTTPVASRRNCRRTPPKFTTK